MDPRYNAIVDALMLYFDGLYHSDTKRLAQVFHPDARYVCATDHPMVHLGMGEYFPIVDKRPAPAASNAARHDQIVSIEFARPVTAFARVHCAIGPKFFTDLLTFVYVGGRWQIIAKVFHYDLTPQS